MKTRLHTLCLLGAAAVLGLTVASSVPASASPPPVTVRLAGGETITHFSNGNVLVTAPMHLKTKIKGRMVPDGYGQDNGDCGVSKLWTYASNHTYQLSLIGDPGVVLGNGWADTSTDGIGGLPSVIGISTSHQPPDLDIRAPEHLARPVPLRGSHRRRRRHIQRRMHHLRRRLLVLATRPRHEILGPF